MRPLLLRSLLYFAAAGWYFALAILLAPFIGPLAYLGDLFAAILIYGGFDQLVSAFPEAERKP